MKAKYELNYLSVLLLSPAIKVGDVQYNVDLIIALMQEYSRKCDLMIFPELCLTGATCGDLFLQNDVVESITLAILQLIYASYDAQVRVVIGSPMLIDGKLANCSLFISEGNILGIVPKNETNRWFTKPDVDNIVLNGYNIAIADNLIFHNFCKLGITFGKPTVSSINDLSAAEVVVCLDASPYSYSFDISNSITTLSKLTSQAVLYINANTNESSSEGVFDGKIVAAECGKLIDVSHNMSFDTKKCFADIDIDLINGDRKNTYIYTSNAKNPNRIIKHDPFGKDKDHELYLRKDYYKDPFGTEQISKDANKAIEIVDVQAFALARRIKHIGINSVVIGISSGIDSTLALIVCDRCYDILGYDKKNIYAFSMPGLATSTDSNDIAEKLATSLGVSYAVIPINEAIKQHFKDINYDENRRDVVYENAQARYRTMLLFDYANKVNGIVIGTGDMSEAMLGWCTFNGDHISNYNVNAGVPKTVAKAILKCIAENNCYPNVASDQIKRIVEKPISPELIPPDENGKVQETEEILGLYEIHDFYMYYYLKYFLSEKKLLHIANYTFAEKYSSDTLQHCLGIFLKRFRANQYKRSCSADGPSIFDISLSPRDGFIIPGDV